MSWAQRIVDLLKAQDIRFIVYVPDMVVWQVLQLMEEDPFFHLVAATREEEALGIASGAYAARKRSAVFMQSSGFGNCLNALGSLCIPYRIPFPMFISLRGELGEFNIAQVALGRAVVPILDSLALQHFAPRTEAELEPMVDGAIRLCYSSRTPVAVLLAPMLTGGKRG
ncbi:MAG: decarboxylase [Chloroflexi bacterium]|nr:decarboxylase [Chloroflexota bacterium]